MDVTVSFDHRLRKNNQFQVVFRKGKSKANRQFVVYYVSQPHHKTFRFGLSVSKRVGNAVVRNRIKRRVREVMREFEPRLDAQKDYVIIARKPTADMSYKEMKKSLQHVLKLSRVLDNKKHREMKK